MNTPSSIIPASDVISKPLERLFKVGGFALAFGFAGLLLTLSASQVKENLELPTFYAGCALVFVCLAYFVVNNIRTRDVRHQIKSDLPLLDSLQKVALQLTDLLTATQAVAFKHLPEIQSAVEALLPLLEALPFVGPDAKSSGILQKARLSAAIVSTSQGAREAVHNIGEAIRTSNLKQLREYASKLSEATDALNSVLRA